MNPFSLIGRMFEVGPRVPVVTDAVEKLAGVKPPCEHATPFTMVVNKRAKLYGCRACGLVQCVPFDSTEDNPAV